MSPAQWQPCVLILIQRITALLANQIAKVSMDHPEGFASPCAHIKGTATRLEKITRVASPEPMQGTAFQKGRAGTARSSVSGILSIDT